MAITETIETAAQALAEGGIVLLPTDTVYGLAVDAVNPIALERLQQCKGRAPKKGFPIAVADRAMAARYVRLGEHGHALADRLWPGGLTIAAPTRQQLPEAVSEGGYTAAVRVPDHPACRQLLAAFGGPFTITSANASGDPTPTTVTCVRESLGKNAQMIAATIDAGELPARSPSTIVDISDASARVIREGAVSHAAVYAALSEAGLNGSG